MQGFSPIASGVDFIPLLLSEMVALIAVGAVVRIWGYYVRTGSYVESMPVAEQLHVPYMIRGESICIAGTGLLTQPHPTTPTVSWAAYLVVSSIGMGIAMQLPYTAVQVTLE